MGGKKRNISRCSVLSRIPSIVRVLAAYRKSVVSLNVLIDAPNITTHLTSASSLPNEHRIPLFCIQSVFSRRLHFFHFVGLLESCCRHVWLQISSMCSLVALFFCGLVVSTVVFVWQYCRPFFAVYVQASSLSSPFSFYFYVPIVAHDQFFSTCLRCWFCLASVYVR